MIFKIKKLAGVVLLLVMCFAVVAPGMAEERVHDKIKSDISDWLMLENKPGDGATMESCTLTGTVLDLDGVAVPGVTVVEKGTTNGVVTDVDGNFTITISECDGVILMFSRVGSQTLEIVIVKSSTKLIVVLHDL